MDEQFDIPRISGDPRSMPNYASLVEKVHPGEPHLNLSPKMVAILGYLLDQAWTEPRIVSLAITTEGHVVSDGDFLGSAEELDRNLRGIADASDLTRGERTTFFHLRDIAVEDHRLAGPRTL